MKRFNWVLAFCLTLGMVACAAQQTRANDVVYTAPGGYVTLEENEANGVLQQVRTASEGELNLNASQGTLERAGDWSYRFTTGTDTLHFDPAHRLTMISRDWEGAVPSSVRSQHEDEFDRVARCVATTVMVGDQELSGYRIEGTKDGNLYIRIIASNGQLIEERTILEDLSDDPADAFEDVVETFLENNDVDDDPIYQLQVAYAIADEPRLFLLVEGTREDISDQTCRALFVLNDSGTVSLLRRDLNVSMPSSGQKWATNAAEEDSRLDYANAEATGIARQVTAWDPAAGAWLPLHIAAEFALYSNDAATTTATLHSAGGAIVESLPYDDRMDIPVLPGDGAEQIALANGMNATTYSPQARSFQEGSDGSFRFFDEEKEATLHFGAVGQFLKATVAPDTTPRNVKDNGFVRSVTQGGGEIVKGTMTVFRDGNLEDIDCYFVAGPSGTAYVFEAATGTQLEHWTRVGEAPAQFADVVTAWVDELASRFTMEDLSYQLQGSYLLVWGYQDGDEELPMSALFGPTSTGEIKWLRLDRTNVMKSSKKKKDTLKSFKDLQKELGFELESTGIRIPIELYDEEEDETITGLNKADFFVNEDEEGPIVRLSYNQAEGEPVSSIRYDDRMTPPAE